MSNLRQESLVNLDLDGQRWRLMTDQVMGGVSTGNIVHDRKAGRTALMLRGHVSTSNSGGFIQAVYDIGQQLARSISSCSGVRLVVCGNAHAYNIHLRTDELVLPWQSYRAQFSSTSEWQVIKLPFDKFIPYKTDRPLQLVHLKRIGLVAIGEDFDADIAISEIGFYRD